MKKSKGLFLLGVSALLISGCSPDKVSSSSSSSSSSGKETESWNEKEEQLLAKYCGEILPYPSGFEGQLIMEETYDEEADITYLLIANESSEFSIGDYYKELESSSSFSTIRGYNGLAQQTRSDGSPYYELTKVSEDEKKGYSLSYTFFDSGNEKSDAKYNLIQCFNDLDSTLDDKSAWKEEEKELFLNRLENVPPLLALSATNAVSGYGEDMAVVHDYSAVDLTLSNVAILKNDGYVLDEALSKEKDAYILKKKVSDEATLIVSLYYSFGNYATFAYQTETSYSKEWPKALSDEFKERTGYDLPSFYSSSGYYYRNKKGVVTIYGYVSDASSYLIEATMSLNELLVFDVDRGFYTDWKETFYILPEADYDEEAKKDVFGITYSYLSSPYDTLKEGYPNEEIAAFLKDNDIEGSIPDFSSFISSSASSSVRIERNDYDDVYARIYPLVKENPTEYGIEDATDEEAIKAKVASFAKENTSIKIKFLETGERKDPEDTSSRKANKVYEYLKDVCYQNELASTYNQNFSDTYENASGKMAIGVSNYLNMTTLTFTFGSGETHTPTFKFETKSKSLLPGDTYNLDLTISMLPYEVTYSSSDSKVTVNDEGCVKIAPEAEPGLTVTITASVEDKDGKVYSDTCLISVIGTYTKETAANKISSLYNEYFSLKDGDTGFAKIESVGDESWPIYSMKVATNFASVKELEDFVDENLIPAGFNEESIGWKENDVLNLGVDKYENHFYSCQGEDDIMINANFVAYIDPLTNKVTLYVRIA